MTWDFNKTKAGYHNMWLTATLQSKDHDKALKVADRILAMRSRYDAVGATLGIPGYWIGAIHDREAGGSFLGVLHNGQHIIGTGRKTTIAPLGRGPFATWEEAAVDALKLKGLDGITDWSAERMLFEAERYNGLGYTSHGENSPYVWASTNHEQLGKYVSDGKYSASTDDVQLGVAAILLALCERKSDIANDLGKGVAPPPVVPPKPDFAEVVKLLRSAADQVNQAAAMLEKMQ
jgi:lysozyme family protein